MLKDDFKSSSYRIMVVDDNPENIKVIGSILRETGFLVTIALSGKQALQIVKRAPPDLILLDIIMPELDGIETCKRLKEDPLTKGIPVIFLSALTDTINKIDGFKAGAIDYLTKPVNGDELIVRIQTHLTIKNLNEELKGINDILEERVKSRTVELRTRNRELVLEVERRKEKEYIINSAASGIATFDTEGRLTYSNPAFRNMWGYGRTEEINGMPFSGFYVGGYDFEDILQDIKVRGEWGREIKGVKKDGSFFHTQVSAAMVYGKEGEESGLMATFLDISEKMRLREMVVHNDKILSLGGLSAGMAHEINNPLAGIVQNVQNLERRLAADHPGNEKIARECDLDLNKLVCYTEKRHINEMMQGIKAAGERIASLVENMLDFSRNTGGELKKQDFSVIIRDAVGLADMDQILRRKYNYDAVNLKIEIEGEIPQVLCDRQSMEQVILNSIGNSVQALYRCEKANPEITLLLTARGDHVALAIKDNGPGIPADIQARIFDPFFTTKEAGEGTGLGLYISYFIVTERHNGTIKVNSEPGEGTEIIIKLPLS